MKMMLEQPCALYFQLLNFKNFFFLNAVCGAMRFMGKELLLQIELNFDSENTNLGLNLLINIYELYSLN